MPTPEDFAGNLWELAGPDGVGPVVYAFVDLDLVSEPWLRKIEHHGVTWAAGEWIGGRLQIRLRVCRHAYKDTGLRRPAPWAQQVLPEDREDPSWPTEHLVRCRYCDKQLWFTGPPVAHGVSNGN